MSAFRERHDRTRRALDTISRRHGHPLRACVEVTVHGRASLRGAWPTRFRIDLDLLLGQSSERELYRQIQDAIESVYLSDLHMAQRQTAESALANKADAGRASHAAHEAERASKAKGRTVATRSRRRSRP